MNRKITTDSKSVFAQYRKGNTYKEGLGTRGLFEQSKLNERFYIGDQWHGAKCGEDRPLVRRNIIKRIGEYKMSTVTAAPIAVNYTADGVADNTALNEKENIDVAQLSQGQADFTGETDEAEISFVMRTLSDYFKITAERVKLDAKKETAVRNAYISGTGIIHTYWDDRIETGLYVDEAKSVPIKGDISIEVIDVENVVFGEPNNDDVQSQPFIIISQRRDCEDVRREAKRNGISAEEIEQIKPDGANEYYNAGDIGELEPSDSNRVTVLTKFYKEWDKSGNGYKVMCVRVAEKATVRKPWDLKIKRYPLAKFCWERRRSSAYGESEVTYLIPNQIAINRALTASVWAVMKTGMPMTIVNGDIVTEPITNNPGQIIKVFGANEDVAGAIRHLSPPAFNGQLQNAVASLAADTLADSGANDAALGNIRPDNAAAIIQMREATLQPMQIYQNRFYDFIEDIARIWADFWINLYGDRKLRVEDKNGVSYIPFHASRYQNLLINARIDVGASTLWSTSVVVGTLDSLLDRQKITFKQYLERLPGGLIPDVTGLMQELTAQEQAAEAEAATSDEAILQQFAQQQPELYAKYQSLDPSQQQALLAKVRGQMGLGAPAAPEGEIVQ